MGTLQRLGVTSLLGSLTVAMVLGPVGAYSRFAQGSSPALRASLQQVYAHKGSMRSLPLRGRGIRRTGTLAAGSMTAAARMLVVAVAFSDKPASQKLSVFRQLYFGQTGSVADYYRRSSYGAFTLTGDVVGDPSHPEAFLTLPHTEAYYAGKDNGSGSPYPHNADGMVSDAIRALVSQHFDFSPYSVGGKIPYLSLVYSGYGADVDAGNPSLIWPEESDLNTPITVALPKQGATTVITSYDLVPELSDSSGSAGTLGVMAHEFGHLLGLDDMYDTSGASTAGQGDGPWSIMASGNWNGEPSGSSPAELDPVSRMLLGWLNPIPITESETGVPLPAIETTAVTYQLGKAGAEDYFLLDNVQPIAYDAALPESGVLIWHVDGAEVNPASADYVANTLNTPSQNKSGHYDIQIEEASGSEDLSTPDGGGYDDTYPSKSGNQSFSATSRPSAELWNHTLLGLNVSHIAVAASGMATFDVIDSQSGASFSIARPSTGLVVYQGQEIPLTGMYIAPGPQASVIDVSTQATWAVAMDPWASYEATQGVGTQSPVSSAGTPVGDSVQGDSVLVNGSVPIVINGAYGGLQAQLHLQVVPLRKLVLTSIPGTPVNANDVVLPRVFGVYANGQSKDVTQSVRWRVSPETGSISHGVFHSRRSGRARLLAQYGGLSVIVSVYTRQSLAHK